MQVTHPTLSISALHTNFSACKEAVAKSVGGEHQR